MWYVNWELAGPATGAGNTGNWTSSNGKGGLPETIMLLHNHTKTLTFAQEITLQKPM